MAARPCCNHARALTADIGALATLLYDLSTEFTYNDELRPSLDRIWRSLMAVVLTEFERDPGSRTTVTGQEWP